MQQRRRQRGGLGIFLLFSQLYQVGFNRIPPVTLGAIVVQALIFLNLIPYQYLPFSSTSKICVSALNVWFRRDYKRLFLAAIYHLDEWHLYYNMVSFLWKGIQLEKKFKSPYFAYLLVVFCVACNAMLVALSILAERCLNNSHYISDCAAGFSGVIFALKVLTTHYSPASTEFVMGMIPCSSKYVCWVELVLIQLVVPNASFIGHLAGILVGLLYIQGPLKWTMDLPLTLLKVLGGSPAPGPHPQRAAFAGVGQRLFESENFQFRSNPNTGSEDEMMNQAIHNSLNDMHQSKPSPQPSQSRLYPDLSATQSQVNGNTHSSESEQVNLRPNAEEIRRRRLARLGLDSEI